MATKNFSGFSHFSGSENFSRSRLATSGFATLGAGHPEGHDCIEGHANTQLQDQSCRNNMHYACIPKWKGVDGPNRPGVPEGEVSNSIQFR